MLKPARKKDMGISSAYRRRQPQCKNQQAQTNMSYKSPAILAPPDPTGLTQAATEKIRAAVPQPEESSTPAEEHRKHLQLRPDRKGKSNP